MCPQRPWNDKVESETDSVFLGVCVTRTQEACIETVLPARAKMLPHADNPEAR
jgi:hypothetical protein